LLLRLVTCLGTTSGNLANSPSPNDPRQFQQTGHRGGFNICTRVLYKSLVSQLFRKLRISECNPKRRVSYASHMHHGIFPFIRNYGITPKYGQSTLSNKFKRYTTDIPLSLPQRPVYQITQKYLYKIKTI
jgi:hypothetical protein